MDGNGVEKGILPCNLICSLHRFPLIHLLNTEKKLLCVCVWVKSGRWLHTPVHCHKSNNVSQQYYWFSVWTWQPLLHYTVATRSTGTCLRMNDRPAKTRGDTRLITGPTDTFKHRWPHKQDTAFRGSLWKQTPALFCRIRFNILAFSLRRVTRGTTWVKSSELLLNYMFQQTSPSLSLYVGRGQRTSGKSRIVFP